MRDHQLGAACAFIRILCEQGVLSQVQIGSIITGFAMDWKLSYDEQGMLEDHLREMWKEHRLKVNRH